MKKKFLIIVPIVIVILLLILIFVITRDKYVGIWNNVIVYDNLKISSTIKISSNGNVVFEKVQSDTSEKYMRTGTWKKEKDHIVLAFKKDNSTEKYPIYLNDNNSFCFESKDCHKSQIYYKKSIFSKKVEYIYDTKQKEASNKEPQWENITQDKDNKDNVDNNIDTSLETKKDGKVVIYFFRGEGCPHCQEAEEWFDSIKGEYGDLFTIVDYETWYNQDNAKLMEAIAKSRGETVGGVPYIIIGNKSWNGFTESYEQEIINELKTNYNN